MILIWVCIVGFFLLALAQYHSPNIQTMPDSWHEEWNKKRNEEAYQERRRKVLREKNRSKLKGQFFKEIPLFKKNNLEMSSDLGEFMKAVIQEGDCNLAWKYNCLINSFLDNDFHTGRDRYVIKFW